MSDAFAPRTMKRKNVKGLALTAASAKPTMSLDSSNGLSSHSSTGSSSAGHNTRTPPDEEPSSGIDIGLDYKIDIRPEDLVIINELGSGNGGTVSKAKHNPTGLIMARKVIHVEANKELRRRIVRELQIMHNCNCEYIVVFYGAFLNDNNDVIMCMEHMDVGSLDHVVRVSGPIRVDVLGKIAEATLGGLTYLYTTHHIMHRDIKPSNILVNTKGQIKLCDFGVSGELINSIADTFVGTSTYMAPERIQGEKYTVKSDVWSFGLSIMELAIGRFPFSPDEGDEEEEPIGILDLLQQIVHEPAPRLPESDAFPSILEDMIQKCLYKDPDPRPTPQELLDRDPFVQAAKRTPVDLRTWALSMLPEQQQQQQQQQQYLEQEQQQYREQEQMKQHLQQQQQQQQQYNEHNGYSAQYSDQGQYHDPYAEPPTYRNPQPQHHPSFSVSSHGVAARAGRPQPPPLHMASAQLHARTHDISPSDRTPIAPEIPMARLSLGGGTSHNGVDPYRRQNSQQQQQQQRIPAPYYGGNGPPDAHMGDLGASPDAYSPNSAASGGSARRYVPEYEYRP